MRYSDSRSGFYTLVVLLDLMVGVTFWMITAPPPVTYAEAVPMPRIVRNIPPVLAIQGIPNRLVVSSVHIDLPVSVGSYDPSADAWTLGDGQAFYADASVPVNDNNGTTLIYGHDFWSVFGNLPDLRAGATAEVYTANGRVFHYQYQSVSQVVPTDTSILTVEGSPALALQTCSGSWDAYRSLYRFAFVSETRL